MTIITQENELINYSAAIKKIAVYAADIDDDNGTKTEVYTILAFDLNSDINDDADVIDGAVQLGVYNTEEECSQVLIDLCSSIQYSKAIFRMPQPNENDEGQN